jgi:hypothetical protein
VEKFPENVISLSLVNLPVAKVGIAAEEELVAAAELEVEEADELCR